MDVVTVGTHHGHHDHNAGLSMTHNSLSDEPSSPESNFDENDLFSSTISDDVTAQLVAAGTIGVAAAAAICTGRKRKRPHIFETNPSIRKRQQTRLLRKLKNTIEEYTTRVGQQAIILTCTPGKPNQSSLSFKVFGSQPLENVIRGCRMKIMQDLESALASQAPLIPEQQMHNNQHELPPLHIDGIPTPVDKMTQAQLRAFIPEMLKFSTGRSKPGWGKPEFRPIWWPMDVPWANVRSDVRSEDSKKKVSWTHALKTVVKNCYKHHNREDLLPTFVEDNQNQQMQLQAQHTMLQTISNPDGSLSIIQIDAGDANHPQIVTLADGTQAQIVHAVNAQLGQHQLHAAAGGGDAGHTVQSIIQDNTTGVAGQLAHQQQLVASGVDLGGVQVATYTDGTQGADAGLGPHLVLSGDTSALNGVVSIPMSMYQTVVTNLPNLSGQNIQVITPGSLNDHQQNILSNLTSKINPVDLVGTHGLGHTLTLSDTIPKQEHEEIELEVHEKSPIEVVTIDSTQMQAAGMEQDSDGDT